MPKLLQTLYRQYTGTDISPMQVSAFLRDACRICNIWGLAVIHLNPYKPHQATLLLSACLPGYESRLESSLQELAQAEVQFEYLPRETTLQLSGEEEFVSIREVFLPGLARVGSTLAFGKSLDVCQGNPVQILNLLIANWIAVFKPQNEPFSTPVQEKKELPIQVFSLSHFLQQWVETATQKFKFTDQKLLCYFSPMLPEYVIGDDASLQNLLDEFLQPILAENASSGDIFLKGSILEETGEAFTLELTLRSKNYHPRIGRSAGGYDVQLKNQGGELVELLQVELKSHHTADVLPPSSPISAPIRILLAEDNELNERFLSYFLSGKGHSVVAVRNGEELLRTACEEKFDLIITDIQMPRLNGLAATQRLRARGLRLPILAQTAFANHSQIQELKEGGITDVLLKPINTDELLLKIQYLLPRPRIAVMDFFQLHRESGFNLNLVLGVLRAALYEILPKLENMLQPVSEKDQLTRLGQELYSLRGSIGALHAPYLWEKLERYQKNSDPGEEKTEARRQKIMQLIQNLEEDLRQEEARILNISMLQ